MSKFSISPQDWMVYPESALIMNTLNKSGEARFVGGCVRDAILGIAVKDIDIATTHLPDEATKLLEKEGVKVIPTGIKHGTITAAINKHSFEITTLRRDAACYGRHADVEFTDSWKQDAARRDFTMNALSMDDDGNIYDYFKGLKDLENGVVRFVGKANDRIKEDYLRVLRMFRFQAYYGKEKLDRKQVDAAEGASSGLKGLSGERIQAEMLKILAAPNPYEVIKTMNEIGVFEAITKGLPGLLRLEMFKTMLGLEEDNKNPITRLAMILYENRAGEEDALSIADMWKLSNEDKKNLLITLFSDYTINSEVSVANQKKALRKIGNKNFYSAVLIRWAFELEENYDNSSQINSYYRHLISLAENWKIPELPIGGEDLLKIGKKEGKEIGALLKKAEEYWESEGYLPTKQDLLKFIKAI